MIVTGEQIRMARALLKLSVRDLSDLTEIDKGTISRIENGGGAQIGTLHRLRSLCEDQGVLFIDPVEGVHKATVAFKWGAEVSQRSPGDGVMPGEAATGGMKAAWDDFEEAADLDALLGEEPGLNPEMWRDDPELWARLSQGGRETLSRSMFGDMRAASADFFRACGQ